MLKPHDFNFRLGGALIDVPSFHKGAVSGKAANLKLISHPKGNLDKLFDLLVRQFAEKEIVLKMIIVVAHSHYLIPIDRSFLERSK